MVSRIGLDISHLRRKDTAVGRRIIGDVGIHINGISGIVILHEV